MFQLPQCEKPAPGRLGDIARPLVQLVKLVAPKEEQLMNDLIMEFYKARQAEKSESLPARVFQAFLACEKFIRNGTVTVSAVAEELNTGVASEKQLTPQRVGRHLNNLGLQRGTAHGGVIVYHWPSDTQLEAISLSLGLQLDLGQKLSVSKNIRIENTSPCPPCSPQEETQQTGNLFPVGELAEDSGEHFSI